MSSAKVSSSAPVGHTAPTVKLNGVRAASPASVTASVSALNDSTNVGTSTDQYLPAGDDAAVPVFDPKPEEEELPLPRASLNDDDAAVRIGLQFMEHGAPFFTIQEVEQRVETYERTVEQSDEPLRKRTQGFG